MTAMKPSFVQMDELVDRIAEETRAAGTRTDMTKGPGLGLRNNLAAADSNTGSTRLMLHRKRLEDTFMTKKMDTLRAITGIYTHQALAERP